MLKAVSLAVAPEGTWQKTALKPPNAWVVLLFSLLPLVVAALAVEGYSLQRLGEAFGEMNRRPVSLNRVIKYEVFYGVASLLVIFFGATLLKNVGASTFNLRCNYSICFVLIAFAYTPLFLVKFLDAVPAINTWVCWAIGITLSLRILYHGVGAWLKPEQTKGFGLLIMSFIYILVVSGLVHFAATQILQGRVLKHLFES
jgi:hypothetical protein